MASQKKKQVQKREGCISKYFRVANPTTDAPSDNRGVSGNDRNVSPVECENFLGPSQQAECPSLWPADQVNIIDLGLVIRGLMMESEVSRAVLGFTASQKYTLLTKHYRPGRNYVLPMNFSNGCCRSFWLKLLDEYPWLVYSKELDGGFCKFC